MSMPFSVIPIDFEFILKVESQLNFWQNFCPAQNKKFNVIADAKHCQHWMSQNENIHTKISTIKCRKPFNNIRYVYIKNRLRLMGFQILFHFCWRSKCQISWKNFLILLNLMSVMFNVFDVIYWLDFDLLCRMGNERLISLFIV